MDIINIDVSNVEIQNVRFYAVCIPIEWMELECETCFC